MEVVGIGLWPEDLQGSVQSVVVASLVSPEFERRYAGEIGSWTGSSMVRLDGGTTAVADLTDAVRKLAGPDVDVHVITAEADNVTTIQAAIDTLAIAVLVLGGVALLASLVVVGQGISRSQAGASEDLRTLRALGLTRSERASALVLPTAVAIVVGITAGALLSVAASPLLPIGIARRAEPTPGVYLDSLVLFGGSGALAAAFVAVSALLAIRAVRGTALVGHSRVPGSRLSSAIARWGASPSLVIGTRFALDAGPTPNRSPVRAAVVAGVVAIAGVLAVAVVATSVSTLADHPDRWGWTWSSLADVYVDSAVESLVADDRIDAVAKLTYASVDVSGEQTQGYAIDHVRGSVEFRYLTGRAPLNSEEVALGQRVLDALDLEVGDEVRFLAADETPVQLRIVGAVIAPMVDSTDPGRGAALTSDGLDLVRRSGGSQQLLLRYRGGVDVETFESELTERLGLEFPVYARADPPGSVVNLTRARGVIASVAVALGLLGLLGVVHSIAVSARKRRADIATLRALGMVRAQLRRTVIWQALTIGVAGLLVGVPLGLVVGRGAWRLMVGDLGLFAAPAQPWIVLVILVPATLAVLVIIAQPTSWRVSRSDATRPQLHE